MFSRLRWLEEYIAIECVVARVVGKEPACQCRSVRDTDLIPGLGRSPGEGNGNTLQYSCLENPMDRGAWQATAYGVGHN